MCQRATSRLATIPIFQVLCFGHQVVAYYHAGAAIVIVWHCMDV